MKNPPDLNAAQEGYARFHKFPPIEQGLLAGLRIPPKIYSVGAGVHICYRSDKWEGIMHDYIHDFEGGVMCYRPDARGEIKIAVPTFVQTVTTLYKLGDCLGFEYTDFDDQPVEAKVKQPLPELYATPDGKALLVIEVDGRSARLLAGFWGGALDVRAEGIVG
jgi:hypothetical protein